MNISNLQVVRDELDCHGEISGVSAKILFAEIERLMREVGTRDCRIIQGSPGVIITQEAAREALNAMRQLAKLGFSGLYADDKSFVLAAMKELERAAESEEAGQK